MYYTVDAACWILGYVCYKRRYVTVNGITLCYVLRQTELKNKKKNIPRLLWERKSDSFPCCRRKKKRSKITKEKKLYCYLCDIH